MEYEKKTNQKKECIQTNRKIIITVKRKKEKLLMYKKQIIKVMKYCGTTCSFVRTYGRFVCYFINPVDPM